MSDIDTKPIVQDVLRFDLEPPSEEYRPYDHGGSVGRELNKESAAWLVAEILRVLPASLASSFLEGVLDCCEVPQLESVLFEVLPHVREISSAGPIVDILLERCKLDPAERVLRLLSEIPLTTDERTQNILAHAVGCMFRESNHGETSSRCMPSRNETVSGSIEAAMSEATSGTLSEYARRILDSYRSWIGRRSGE